MTKLKIITLNIEFDRHLDAVIPFLKKEKADIVCLQEVLEPHFHLIKKELGMKGWFMPIHMKDYTHIDVPKGVEIQQGTVMLTNLSNNGFLEYYFRPKNVIVFTDFTKVARGLIVSSIEHEGKKFNIATVHYAWTPDGQIDDGQKKDFVKLIEFIKPFDDLLLCGDFNAPRGREMFSMFCKHFKDNLPKDVVSTIDENIHRKKGLSYAVDTFFTTPNYKISNVKVVDGISDHKALIGFLE
ncbi:endonuclease/exonuclease/phosphatase family protein [archaeon]|nr:endonuclease/exonuclease/phosphatase family protein [archaeon]MBL7057662.1 endonuclease/exonuclease/phosphatase family protein [Candidatus Woesearchaeota archaeon]